MTRVEQIVLAALRERSLVPRAFDMLAEAYLGAEPDLARRILHAIAWLDCDAEPEATTPPPEAMRLLGAFAVAVYGSDRQARVAAAHEAVRLVAEAAA